MATNPVIDRKYLNLQAIQRLMRFSFVPRRFLDGRFTGRHASPQRGQSVEFRDFRPYMPGDDVGHVDWKVFGRTDKLYLRLFEHETELALTLLVDASASMGYDRRREPTKYDHACCLAAALGFVVMQGQDRVGFAAARDGLLDYQRPATAIPQLLQILDAMQNRQPQGRAALAKALDELASKLRRGEIVAVFTDLWEDLEPFFRAAARVRHVGGELILFHILHPDELELPDWNQALIVDSEQNLKLHVNVSEIRQDYQQRLQQRLREIRDRCQQFELTYQFSPLSESYQQTLETFLARRCRR